MSVDFWQQIDTTRRYFGNQSDCTCVRAMVVDVHDYDCPTWESQRRGTCVALNGDGQRCSNLTGPGLPFCERYHERHAVHAIARALAKDAEHHSVYGDCSTPVRAMLRLVGGGFHLYRPEDWPRHFTKRDRAAIVQLFGLELLAPRHKHLNEPTPAVPRECSLYRHFDDEGLLLYVGITVDPAARAKQHQATSPWWRFVASTDTEWFASQDEAAKAEKRAIKNDAPIFNKAKANTERDARAVRYLIDAGAIELLRAVA